MDFHGGQCKKKGKSQGVTVNLTGNPGGELQENRYPQQIGGTIVSRKSSLKTFLRRLRDIHGVKETYLEMFLQDMLFYRRRFGDVIETF